MAVMHLLGAHRCTRVHRTYAALARCSWGSSAQVLRGEGPYVLISECPGPRTLTLWPTQREAEVVRALLERSGCSGTCRNQHGLVRIGDAA